MPIIEPPINNEPLNQGDMLRGVKLYMTANVDVLAGGESVPFKSDTCLVLSRPCVTAHKSSIVVAAVQKLANQTPSEIKSLKEALDFLTKLRDGVNSPDLFYLGQLIGKETEGRYVARLDSLHTIAFPQKPDARSAFIEKHRFARLNRDFSRDLHTRLFQSIASLGFEDVTWLSNPDLQYLIGMGNAEIKWLESEKDRIAAAMQADGGKGNELQSVLSRISDIETRLNPYAIEMERRTVKPGSGPAKL